MTIKYYKGYKILIPEIKGGLFIVYVNDFRFLVSSLKQAYNKINSVILG